MSGDRGAASKKLALATVALIVMLLAVVVFMSDHSRDTHIEPTLGNGDSTGQVERGDNSIAGSGLSSCADSGEMPHANKETPVPVTDHALSALELLNAMRTAYLNKDYKTLEKLRSSGVQRKDVDLNVAKNFFRELVLQKLDRHDGQPTLDYAVADVLISAWEQNRESENAWLIEVMAFATAVLAQNEFVEFFGKWSKPTREPADLEQQRRFYVRPYRDLDTEGMTYLVDVTRSRVSGGWPYETRVPLVDLFASTEDYVNDRLSYAQIYACHLLVELDASWHLADLWTLYESAKIASVKVAALEAYVSLGGSGSLIEIAERWARLASQPKRGKEVKQELEDLVASTRDFKQMFELTRTYFQMLHAADIGWTYYSEGIIFGGIHGIDSLSPSELLSAREAIRELLVNEDDIATVATWASWLSRAYHATDDLQVLGLIKRHLYRILQDESLVRNTWDRNRAIVLLVKAYHRVLSDRRQADWIDLLVGSYAISLPSMLGYLDEAMIGQLAYFIRRLTASGVNENQIVPLLEGATRRAAPIWDKLPYETSLYAKAWTQIEGEVAYESLSKLVEEASTEGVKQVYIDLLIEWEKARALREED